MCNEFQIRVSRADYAAAFARLGVPLRWTDPEPVRAADDPIRPTNRAALIRPCDPVDPRAGLDGVERRWWMIPAFHKGPVAGWKPMTTLAPIATVDATPAFREAYRQRRALVPVSSFIAYDAPAGWRKGQPKRRWEAAWTPADDEDRIRYFAAVWDRAQPSDLAEPIESFAILAGPPGPDLAAVQDAAPAVLTLEQGLQWLDLAGPGKAALVTATPAGTYRVTEAPRVQLMTAEMRRALP
ncbi:SOS response-associated peptidase family protein [Phenylobacterium aquaticum]|uniref:SOS response-associated peptidase family protein n=1 Tax=Phenylobacterium aquaticum TaxID=1763816 RepID=UPI0026E92966|nr:SOS response-associated peptidase family protein [Phenylobacterium aquaticum]